MLNYFNFKKIGSQYLITNDTGKYQFLSEEVFAAFLQEKSLPEEIYHELKDNFFLYDEHEHVFSEKIKYYIRDNKNYLFSATSLHIFVLTNVCNMSCVYCQAKDDTKSVPHRMSKEVAEKSVDIALSSPSRYLGFEFQGGEPLTNFEVLKHIINYTEKRKKGKNISYSLVTNLSLLTQEILDFLIEHHVNISTSLDGAKALHNKNRSFQNGGDTFDTVIEKIKKIQEENYEVGAIQTTTRASLGCAKEIIDIYVSCKQTSIFIRPLTRLGTADRAWDKVGYTAEEFLAFYEECLRYIIRLNQEGTDICERHAVIFLKKILDGFSENYMELRSPCGAAIGQMAYFYDGSVFTCDEGRMLYEMGNPAFQLGSVFEHTYDDLIQSPTCKTVCVASLLEGQLNCCDCVYQPYCGTCPVINLAQENDLFFKSAQSFRCKVYGGMLDCIFSILQENKPEERKVFYKWLGVEWNEENE
ncbi:His-Xaa-Ser system radical SAM maturase HxsB [Sinanaerobacter sp. ZZT-01]|uniref:His-Xaa-Ser system radical SAM maturase HxsB n=1 Tax=Sinanaerobacter sp. ZZT-01 TaxID=3111540 RepID=UPI002D790DB9|nr:His-Xaa-Ser system radical SAM maturase HxsB [Sinanaerobacter sp. ZZT-01]WRR92395.1 His-Xaa-Ser system radical SAM maturase HxsB [Sinanaerobacter sp. ZZT-01]